MDIEKRIKELSKKYFDETVAIRRHIHQNPELAFDEWNTSKFIAEKLAEYGIEFNTGIAKTGIVGTIHGTKSEPQVALRADMDALPIFEKNQVDYKSQNEGIMHACGHDAHSASLLGTARILQELRAELPGSIRLIFQPSEEKLPGGASVMIEEGVLENPKPKAVLGQHVMPFIDSGRVGFRPGKYMASADEIKLIVTGKGGHAALPHLASDTVSALCQIIVNLQQVVARKANPLLPTVLSFCTIKAGNGAYNVLPERAEVLGTLRTMDEDWRARAHQFITDIAESTARSLGAECKVEILNGYPVLFNAEELTGRTIQYAHEYMEVDNCEELDLWMAAEDFAYYSQKGDACFYRLGTRNTEKGITSAVHTPTFNIDEDSLEIGSGLMAYLAFKNLEHFSEEKV